MIGTGLVDAERGPAEAQLDFASAPHWHLLVLLGRRPAVRVDLPSPGVVNGSALTAAAVLRRADAERARDALIARLRQRLGAAAVPEPEPLWISVIVCTHRRSHYLPDLLAGLGRLDPAPFEVIVVDNDPGEEDCEERVRDAGYRYVREDRRGLDNARNCGLRVAQGDIVVYTDDDCVPSAGWLAPLARAFAHEGVAAVTGPAFPYVLDTPARIRMERQASLARGLRRLAFDWQVISPLHAAAMGVGANMAFRRSYLLELGPEPFPPELDAGTETESGGDTYVLSRLLADGERVIYEPEMFTFHQHRPDGPALHRALRGYGMGLSAALTKLVVEQHELSAPRAWIWLVRQYLRTQRRRAVGRADAVETRLSWEYLVGGLRGAGSWRRALETQRLAGAEAAATRVASSPARAAVAMPVVAGASQTADAPSALAVSVVVPTFRRPPALRRCLDALAAQDAPPGSFEVVVVDDDDASAAPLALPDAYPFALRVVRSGGRGAAGARNCGARHAAAELLLFLDDDVVADPWLVRRHLEWHAKHPGPAALVGPYRPRPTRPTLAAAVARLWWQDLFRLLDGACGTTFVSALTANVSLPRSLHDKVGGFAEDFSRARREDWEWGLRLRRAGVPIAFEPTASGRHEFSLDTAQRLRDSRREGTGDVLIATRYPEALPSLPLLHHRPTTPRAPVRWLGFWLWRTEPIRAATIAVLDLLERGRLRGIWMRVFRLAQSAAYAHGVHDGGWRQGSAPAAQVPLLQLELLSDESVVAPAVAAPLVSVTLAGNEVARLLPAEGVWSAALAEQIADALPPEAVARAAQAGGWLDGPPEQHDHAHDVEVILGPAHPPADLATRGALEREGAQVTVVGGAPERHWGRVLAAARASRRPLVALPLPGTAPAAAWLAEALSAFDGERVGLAFGGCLDQADAVEPLYLHDRGSADMSLTLAGPAPAYLVLRRELASRLEPSDDLPGTLVAAVGFALDEGWIVAHRDVHGLAAPSYDAGERGAAYGRLEADRLKDLTGSTRVAATARATARGLLTLGWQAFKQRGRLTTEQRTLARGVARGALSAARSPRNAPPGRVPAAHEAPVGSAR